MDADHEHRLQGEFPAAGDEHLLEVRTEHFHDECVASASGVGAIVVDLRDAFVFSEDAVEIIFAAKLRMFHHYWLHFNGHSLPGIHVLALVQISVAAAAEFLPNYEIGTHQEVHRCTQMRSLQNK